MYSDMSRRTIAVSSLNRYSASALVSSVLPTPVGPKNMNEPIARFGPRKPGRPRRPGCGVADHPPAERVLHLEQVVLFALQHLVDGNAGPARDHLRDVVGGDRLLHHLAGILLGLDLGQPLLQLRHLAI